MIPQPQQQITAGAATEQSQDPMESAGEASTEAPPKQVALAMERLASAARKIADIRLGADRLLEALFLATGGPQQLSNKTAQLILREETSMRSTFRI